MSYLTSSSNILHHHVRKINNMICKYYFPDDLRFTCIISLDYNECLQNTDACDQNADCTNIVGSHICQCRSGYTGDGNTCTGKNNQIDMRL